MSVVQWTIVQTNNSSNVPIVQTAVVQMRIHPHFWVRFRVHRGRSQIHSSHIYVFVTNIYRWFGFWLTFTLRPREPGRLECIEKWKTFFMLAFPFFEDDLFQSTNHFISSPFKNPWGVGNHIYVKIYCRYLKKIIFPLLCVKFPQKSSYVE